MEKIPLNIKPDQPLVPARAQFYRWVGRFYNRRMWEKFPPRMRSIVASALQDAGEHGLESAGVEQLVRAVARDSRSAGAFMFEQAGLRLDRIIGQFDSSTPSTQQILQRAERFDEGAMAALAAAERESQARGEGHVGTEHFALALARLQDSPAAQWLQAQGLSTDAAEAAFAKYKKRGAQMGPAAPRAASPSRAWARRLLSIHRLPRILWAVLARKSLAHPGYVRNPYPLYRWLREHEPVRRDPLAPVWVLTRHDDIAMMLRDPRFRKDPYAAERLPREARLQLGAGPTLNTRADVPTVSMLFLDPPAHTRVRSMFSRAFTPKSLADLRPRIEAISARQLDRLSGRRNADLILEYAYPLPVMVIAELLGFPESDYQKIKSWSDDFAAALALNAKTHHGARAAKAHEEIRKYFNARVELLKTHPSDTLVSRLIAAESEPAALSREEIFINSVLLLAAGHETTTNLIGNGLLAFMRNRDQWELLVSDRSRVESAVEEMLRYDSPVQWVSRVAGEVVDIGGRQIADGQIVLGSFGAANRDPARFANPERFDICRSDSKHLSFGLGPHFCLGAALARMEAQIALSHLTARFPNMTLASRRVKWMKGLTFRGVKKLNVNLG